MAKWDLVSDPEGAEIYRAISIATTKQSLGLEAELCDLRETYERSLGQSRWNEGRIGVLEQQVADARGEVDALRTTLAMILAGCLDVDCESCKTVVKLAHSALPAEGGWRPDLDG